MVFVNLKKYKNMYIALSCFFNRFLFCFKGYYKTSTLYSLALGIFEVFLQIFLFANLSLNQTLLAFLLCETILDDSIDSGNFSVRGYLLLIQKYSSTHIHGLPVYVKEGVSFAQDLSLENSADSYLCFRLALPHSVSYFFFLYRSPFCLYVLFLILFDLTQMRFS